MTAKQFADKISDILNEQIPDVLRVSEIEKLSLKYYQGQKLRQFTLEEPDGYRHVIGLFLDEEGAKDAVLKYKGLKVYESD